ncbi:MAG: hypothetical protein J0I10_23110 [Verrucomicrobia bacterium]|nr:hypothetical protein [Verrucomicrobiota bacterium]
MEYIPSVTLKEYVKMCVGVRNILGLAYAYIELINKTTAPETLHGDPHACNVLVCKEQVSKYETLLVLKLCDYGTSKFNKNADSGVRHWKTVWMTLVYITKRLPGSDVARAAVKEFKEISIANFNEMSRRPDLFSAEEMSRALSAFMRDYLSYWDYEWNFGG